MSAQRRRPPNRRFFKHAHCIRYTTLWWGRANPTRGKANGSGDHFQSALDSAPARPHHNDGHLEPAIYVDTVHEALPDDDRRRASSDPDHLLALDRPADLLLAGAGLAG